ncbi:hypothetical protein F4859DRAFT_525962 [Xylaria cf. heliscus]|nr:hypothetical protein F4859DRAFT_525962 [Xylaria cf. heliscus]
MDDFAYPRRRKNSMSPYSSTLRTTKTPPSTTAASESTHNPECMAFHRSSSMSSIGSPVASVPEPGKTYKIVEIVSERAITLIGGRLVPVLDVGTRGGWQWDCEENPDGWIGFRNAVSGRYLGHDNKGGYIAQANKLDAWESFTLRPRTAGGYNLCVKHGSKLKPMGISDDGSESKLVDAQSYEEAARWEFYEVR